MSEEPAEALGDVPEMEGLLLQPSSVASLDRLIFRGTFGGTRRPVRVRVSEGVLYLDDEPVPAEHCVSGYVQSEVGGGVLLRLTDTERHPRLDLSLPSKQSAQHILGALGLDADRVAVPFTATHTGGGVMAVIALIFALVAAFALEVLWLRVVVPTLLVMLSVLLGRMARYPFLVAPDGIWFQRYGREHMLDWSSIERVDAVRDTTVVVTLRDGRIMRFDFETRDHGVLSNNMEDRIQGQVVPTGSTNEAVAELLNRHLTAAAAADLPLQQSLQRSGRSMQKWLADVQRLARGRYRSEAVTPPQLWRLVEDGSVPVSARAAAGWLLRVEGEQAEQRLRSAASNTASPRLRIALNALSEHDEKAQHEALAALEAEEQERAERTQQMQ